MDVEDEDFKNIVIRRFLQLHPINSQYVEIDAEFAEEFDNIENDQMLERILSSKKKKKYMMHVRIHESKFFSYEIETNGIRFDKREEIETWFGRNYNMRWQDFNLPG